MKRSSDSGSSPLELVVLTALLVLPVGLATAVYQQLGDELAAESIARHALRYAMLENPERPSQALAGAVEVFADDWLVEVDDYRYWCSLSCSLVTLEITIGDAVAIQTMGLPRT